LLARFTGVTVSVGTITLKTLVLDQMTGDFSFLHCQPAGVDAGTPVKLGSLVGTAT